ncbi:MAG: hypothetical protein WCF69_10990, partial [Mycobacterium sp.]
MRRFTCVLASERACWGRRRRQWREPGTYAFFAQGATGDVTRGNGGEGDAGGNAAMPASLARPACMALGALLEPSAMAARAARAATALLPARVLM